MTFKCKPFEELTTTELYEIIRARNEIFLLEQHIICQDLDGVDYDALHCFLWESDSVIAYLRAYRADADTVKIGRVLTLTHGVGLGARLMRESLPEIKKRLPSHTIALHAQSYATGFYERCGFAVTSAEFMEEGIPHVEMKLQTKDIPTTMQTSGTVVAVTRQWWCKINTKAVRMGTFDGAVFPHVVRVEYTVDGKTYVRRAWVRANAPVPTVGDRVTVHYDAARPAKAKLSFAISKL